MDMLGVLPLDFVYILRGSTDTSYLKDRFFVLVRYQCTARKAEIRGREGGRQREKGEFGVQREGLGIAFKARPTPPTYRTGSSCW
jgi:hypothetical protein